MLNSNNLRAEGYNRGLKAKIRSPHPNPYTLSSLIIDELQIARDSMLAHQIENGNKPKLTRKAKDKIAR